ncbi:alpha-ribazole phosphatase family protein [Pseudomonas stutzeri]|uniref:alpha-ribazole phosphatase family protein n=1 Tax=Stutzerimonas stutzeri TaxID=316 RepID=UPI0021089ED1|nr:alpha-ribazole phosphatase family protein [Stutzerimonas stutzeri]MCQ4287007.1 alpha-ribazole phosphatase family protein [Stutzerimonas stutzeri]
MNLHLDMLRHGETVSGGGFRGRLDDALTEAGWQQMRHAVTKAGPWDRIITSPLRRCAAFAVEWSEQCNLPLEFEPDLRELDFGDWEGRTAAGLMVDQSDALGRFWNDPYGYTPPGGERLIEFETRVLTVIERLTDRFAGERILLITHAGVMRLLLAEARGLPRGQLLQIEVSHGGMCGLKTGFADATLWLEEACSPF